MESLRDQLLRHEGYVRHVYTDTEGYQTIGIGRLVDRKLGGGLSKEEALYLLDNDIKVCEKELSRYYPWWKQLASPARQVLLNMCFNLGVGRLMNFSKMWGALQNRNYLLASIEMLDSKWADQVGNRAIELAEMMRTS